MHLAAVEDELTSVHFHHGDVGRPGPCTSASGSNECSSEWFTPTVLAGRPPSVWNAGT